MSDTPTQCPTCGTAVPPGAVRCPGCGRVFGEVNRCPSCNAVAGVRRKGGGYVCMACGKPREVQPGTTILDDGRPGAVESMARSGVDPAAGALAQLMRGMGLLMVVAAIAAGATAALGPGAPVALLVAIAVILGVGGVTSMSSAKRVEGAAKARRARQLEQRLLRLAEKRNGDVVATDAAKTLGVGLAEADAMLTSMADGSRVTVEVDPDGIVHYVFREIAGAKGPRVRVDPAADAKSEQEAIEAEAAARVEREIAKRERI